MLIRSMIDVIQHRPNTLIVQWTHKKDIFDILHFHTLSISYCNVMCFKETIYPTFHMKTKKLYRKQICLVHYNYHWLVMNQLVEMRNDTSLGMMNLQWIYRKIHHITHRQNQRMLLERNSLENLLWNRNRNIFSLHLIIVPQLQKKTHKNSYLVTSLTNRSLVVFQTICHHISRNIPKQGFIPILQLSTTPRTIMNFFQFLLYIDPSPLFTDYSL